MKLNKFKLCDIIDLDVSSPLELIKMSEKFKIFKQNSDNLFSVTTSKNPYFNMVEIKNNKVKLVISVSTIHNRQKAPKL